MRNLIDFSSWHGALTTLLGLVVFSLVAVGLRLLLMQRVQQRRERQNRQINERLKTLIAAYKTLGGSFTGDLAVDPRHLRDMRPGTAQQQLPGEAGAAAQPGSSERRRRTRDAVEAALSDVILLGTAEQVGLAVQAARDMVAGRPVHTAALVVSLRSFIREVLQLEAVPADLHIPAQGPVRSGGAAGRGSAGAAGRAGGGASGGGGAGGGMASGAAMGLGAADGPPARALRLPEDDASGRT